LFSDSYIVDKEGKKCSKGRRMPEEEDPLGTILYSTAVRPLLGKTNAVDL